MKNKSYMKVFLQTACLLFVAAIFVSDLSGFVPESCKKKGCPHLVG